MPKGKILIFIFYFVTHLIFAQENPGYVITGQVNAGDTGEPLPMATIVLLNPADSSIVEGMASDSTGRFSLEASAGTYLLKAQFLSYDDVYRPDIRLSSDDPKIELGTIKLDRHKKSLEEIVIEGEQSRMTMEGGKKIFNVGTDLSTFGASAADVLNNIPAVNMDIEGNLSLRGSQGVRILIDGKPSSMLGISSSEALRYFPANQIERVEIITNPSAKYEAQGTAGIINIILKEDQNWGLNGTFTVEGGIPKDHGASVNMNYRRKWYNLFGRYNFNIDRNPGGGWREQTFLYPDTTYSLRTDANRSRGGTNHIFQFGSDFYFTLNDVLRVSGVFSIGDEDNYTDLIFRDYDGGRIHPDDLQQRTMRNELEVEDDNNYELNLSYEKTFGEEGHKLTAIFQGRNSIEVEDANLVETAGFPGEVMDTSLFQNSLNDTDVKAYLAKLDYTWPFSANGKFETGFRAEYREITNIFNVQQRESERDPWNTLGQFSNTFFYDEAIYGVYAMYGNKRGDLSYQAGIRFEYTGIGTMLKTDADENQRSYFNFFPSFALTYQIGEFNSIQASYSRRLDRPYFRQLNPFNTFNNNRNYRTGNPNLDPEFTNAYDLGFINNKGDRSIYVGAFYRKTVNEIERVDTVNNEGITVTIPMNLASRDNVGIEARYSMKFFDWWDFSISSYFFRGSTSGFAAGEDLNTSAYTMSSRARFTFEVKDWFELQLDGDYRAPEKEGQDTEQAMYEINLGIRKEIFNKRGNIALSIRDIFNTDVYRSRTVGSNFTGRNRFQWRRGPSFRLSFTYKLNDSDAERDKSGIFGM